MGAKTRKIVSIIVTNHAFSDNFGYDAPIEFKYGSFES